ncbi:MAG TPA: DUF2325 domain-containing protein [Desulfotomaculum sp.]|nr:DUF2325 domain-containing protein [Desulfotomaculum sp.]
MSILIIGGDRLGEIPDNLKDMGFTRVYHITGRKKRDILREVSPQHEMVLVLTDFVGHEIARMVKADAKRKRVRVLFARRSWSHIKCALDRLAN